MKYLVLDDEMIAAQYLSTLINEVDENAEIIIVNNPIKSLEIAKNQSFDVCFVDIQMPELSGIDFLNELKRIHPRTNIIFVTGYSEYMGEAFRLDASDYILKPASVEQIRHALENLRYNTSNKTIEMPKQKIYITCFGNFEVLIEGKPVKFKFDKTKELLAYLVYRKGARCTSKEIMTALWEDDGHDSYYRMLKKDLIDIFTSLGCEKVIYSSRGQIGLANLECINCDYFLWINNSEEGRKLYHGEFMSQYSWAEDVNALIDLEKYK